MKSNPSIKQALIEMTSGRESSGHTGPATADEIFALTDDNVRKRKIGYGNGNIMEAIRRMKSGGDNSGEATFSKR